MTAASITKTIEKVNNTIELSKDDSFYAASLGFHRLSALPKRVKRAFDLAANLETNWDGAKALQNQKQFLGGLTGEEFVDWLKVA